MCSTLVLLELNTCFITMTLRYEKKLRQSYLN